MESKNLPSKQRHQLLSNENIKYFWSHDENIIHYKTCTRTKSIPDEKLKYSNKYDSSMEQCPECAVRSYVTAYARDPEQYKKYVQDYKDMSISHKLLRKMYVDYHITTRRASDGIYLINNGEWWKITKGTEKGYLKLFHNNYYIDQGERIRCEGFHEQRKDKKRQNLDSILKYITAYDSTYHCPDGIKILAGSEVIIIKPATKNSILGRLYIWIGKKMHWVDHYTV